MARRIDPADAAFFRERDALRVPGVFRSLARALAFAAELGIDLEALRQQAWPVIAVVGSKGKGTTAIYASATLAAAGLRVGTLTSPGFITHRERIRVDGTAISQSEYGELSARLTRALDRSAHTLPGGGYLSPTGLFTLTAIRHFLDTHCDVVVLEAGMGGMSDEIALVDASVVAVTAIFGEHLGILGDSVEGIAANKLGIIGDATVAVATVEQPFTDVMTQVRAAAGHRSLHVVTADQVPAVPSWPAALVGINAQLGVVAAKQMLHRLGRQASSAPALDAVLGSVQLPGRLSAHQRGAQSWLVDSAINATGARAALEWCTKSLGRPDTVLVCVPDDKDRHGVLAELSGLPVVSVRLDAAHLRFDEQSREMLFEDVDLDSLGQRVLALGTISFTGAVLDNLGVNADRVFRPLGQLVGRR